MAPSSVSSATSAAIKGPLRLFALPLCRKPELIYYYAQKKPQNSNDVKEDSSNDSDSNSAPARKLDDSSVKGEVAELENQAYQKAPEAASNYMSYISKATNKATEQWEKFGKAPKGNWKHRIYMTGERLMDRIEYEEWLLKGLDASTAPKLWTFPKPTISSASTPAPPPYVVPLYYPESLVSQAKLRDNLNALIAHREPHHQSLMKKSLIAAPLTFPFAIVPIVPNFPLFYVLWRAWSHWRALRSSQYLKTLISSKHLEERPSSILNELYSNRLKALDAKPTADGEVLLTNEMVDQLREKFLLDEQAGIDLRRAISQLEARLKVEGVPKVEEKVEGAKKS